MKLAKRLFLIVAILFVLAFPTSGQSDEICGERGPASTWLNTSFIYGRVYLNGFDKQKLPKITVVLYTRNGNESRYTIDRSGNYCFTEVNASGGYIAIELEGVEQTRRSIPAGGPREFQHREDFEILGTGQTPLRQPGTITAKYAHPRSEKNTALLDRANSAEKAKELEKAIQLLREIVADDPADFFVWARLGSVYFESQKLDDSEAAFFKSIGAKADFAPAYINLGQVYLVRKRLEKAILVLEKATVLDPQVARGFQLLGEAYLLDRKGTLGVAALNEAIRLDPVGMAESHLLMARLYELAGAKPLASREYRLFLEKVPEHKDRKKFERYIKDNPEEQ